MRNRVIYLLGYTKPHQHTNWYPWLRFEKVLKHLGYDVRWVEKEDIGNEKNRIFFCSAYDLPARKQSQISD